MIIANVLKEHCHELHMHKTAFSYQLFKTAYNSFSETQ